MAKALESLGCGSPSFLSGPIPIAARPTQVILRLDRDRTPAMVDARTPRLGRLHRKLSAPPETEQVEAKCDDEFRRWMAGVEKELLQLPLYNKVGIIARLSYERMKILQGDYDVLSGYENSDTNYVQAVMLEFENDGSLMRARLPPPPKSLPPLPSTKNQLPPLAPTTNPLSTRRSARETAGCSGKTFDDLGEYRDKQTSPRFSESVKSSPNFIERNIVEFAKKLQTRFSRKIYRGQRYESLGTSFEGMEHCEEVEPWNESCANSYEEYESCVLFVFSQIVRAWQWDSTTKLLSLPLARKKKIVIQECRVFQGHFHIITPAVQLKRSNMPKLPPIDKNVGRSGRMTTH